MKKRRIGAIIRECWVRLFAKVGQEIVRIDFGSNLSGSGCTYEYSTNLIWSSYGVHMEFLPYKHKISTDLPWITYGGRARVDWWMPERTRGFP
jgi:hypothetical protein